MLEDCVHFYKEKLGMLVQLAAAVLNKSDYGRVIGATPNRAAPSGMAGVPEGRRIALIRATDDGIITKTLLAARSLATSANLDRLHLLHSPMTKQPADTSCMCRCTSWVTPWQTNTGFMLQLGGLTSC
jgi:hypothetical protein